VKFPEISYFLPGLKDQRTQRLEYFRRGGPQNTSAAGDVVGVSYTVPNDRFVVITDWSARFLGATASDYMYAAALRIVSENTWYYSDGKTIGAQTLNQPQHIGSSCEIWLRPGSVVDVITTISTANVGLLFTSIAGFQIPRGNIVIA